MTARKVLVWPHKGLREVAVPVGPDDVERAKEVAEDLRDTLKAYNAQGLAATQIGIPLRMLAYKESAGTVMVIVNPVIENSDGEINSDEGCLSFPGVSARLKRHHNVVVTGVTIFGDEVALTLHGLEAVAIQHELDHLDGVVMIDHLGKLAKRMALKRLKKVKKRLGAYAPEETTRLAEAIKQDLKNHKDREVA